MTTRSVMVRIRGDVSDLNRAALAGAGSLRKLSHELETSNDRATWLAQGLAAIVPAVAPVAVQGVPALAGLAVQALSSGAALGTTVLAFQGLGDAVKAFRENEANPSAASMKKLQQATENLSPAAQEFVAHLDELMPRLRELQHVAADNMLPGVQQGLDDVMVLLPRVRNLIASVAQTSGGLLAEAGDSLNDPRWTRFFDYVQRQAAPTTAELGRSLGNVTEGVAQLLMAFEPLEQEWSQGMLRMSRSFATWSAGVDQTQDFEDFLTYVEDTGPQVLDTLGSLGNLLIDVGKAAAPLGGPTLTILSTVADVLASIADSPIGTTVIGAVAAVSALSRVMAVQQLLVKKTGSDATGMFATMTNGYRAQVKDLRTLPAHYRQVTAAQRELRTAQADAARVTAAYNDQLQAANRASAAGATRSAATNARLADSLTQVEMANNRVKYATVAAGEAEATRAATFRSGAVAAGKTAAGVGALALATTGAADQFGIANTATLALAGSMFGPLGTGVGTAAGLFLDARAAAKGLADGLEATQKATEKADFSNMLAGLEDLRRKRADIEKMSGVSDALSDFGKSIGAELKGIPDLNSRLGGQIGATETKVHDLTIAYERLSGAMGHKLPPDAGPAEIARVATDLEPKLRALGISGNDLLKMGSAQIQRLSQQLQFSDSAAGRMSTLNDAVKGLDDGLVSTADSAGELATAMQALIGPGLSAEEATDKWRASLAALRSELNSKAGFAGFTDGALKNREVTRGYMADVTGMLTAEAEAGASAGRIASRVAQARDQFIAEGQAAGFSAREIAKRADEMGLTPDLVRTVFEAANLENTRQGVRALLTAYIGLPRAVRTEVLANGIPETEAGMRALQRRYRLTPPQVETLAKLRDLTPAVYQQVVRRLHGIDRMSPQAVARLLDHVTPGVQRAAGALNNLNGKTADTYIRTNYVTVGKPSKTMQLIYPQGGAAGAAGMMFDRGGVQTFARGGHWGTSPDKLNGHVAHMAKPGTWRVFAEDETQGESYIPHANDWRRPRARRILEETARILGGDVAWNAAGSLRGAWSPIQRPTRDLQSLGPLQVSGTLQTPWGPAEVRGLARTEARAAIADYADRQDQYQEVGRAYS